ncbi:pickpocket protein 19-like [Cochliomyia hominivorax]
MAFSSYNPARPLALRQLNKKFDTNFKHKQRSKKVSKQFKKSAKQFALEFGKKSIIHGMNRIFQENSLIYERLFWVVALIAALFGSIYVCLILSNRFNAGVLQTVIDSTNTPVYSILFPEITICNLNHLNWERIDEAKERFLPNETNSEVINLFEYVIGLYDNLTLGDFDVFHALEGKPLELVEHVNFSLVFDFMTWRCEELFTDCKWHYYQVDCCQILLRSKGETGLCWRFNTLSSEEGRRKKYLDKKYPWRTGDAGPQSGLYVRVWVNEHKHYRKDNEKGISVAVMEPEVYHRDPVWIPASTLTSVEVEPVVYFHDNGTRRLASRSCVFKDEHNSMNLKNLIGFTYMFENCHAQCHQEYLVKYCNCTVDLLFPTDTYRICKVRDFLCLAKYNDIFRFTHQHGEDHFIRTEFQGMKCDCVRNCYSLNYVADIRPSFLPAHLIGNNTYVDLDVYYRFDKMLVYRTSLVFDWVDLMVAFGGIVGLFLGCSLISAVELIYFAWIELPHFVLKGIKYKRKVDKIINHDFSLNNPFVLLLTA